jgi:hypothetical protein
MTTAQNTILQLSQVMFAPSNMNKMQKVMGNPVRNLIQLHLSALESLFAAFVAAEGRPDNFPTAMAMFLVERAEDPMIALNILLGMGMKPPG